MGREYGDGKGVLAGVFIDVHGFGLFRLGEWPGSRVSGSSSAHILVELIVRRRVEAGAGFNLVRLLARV